ncbi:MAG TPA: preprotein translocase subunit YajC [Candidatus Aquilonibacter sp.]|nr:preprotein translocase subunit YajC [Candidatus Aquilonibacter sp.]
MHLNYLNVILADTTAPAAASSATTSTGAPAAQPSSPMSLLFPMALIFVVVYFMMIRPQSQQRKQQAKLLAALKSGDKIATSSGIVGTVITVKDKTVSLRSADAKMEVTKSSVTEIIESGGANES